jgi:hypothetical protein
MNYSDITRFHGHACPGLTIGYRMATAAIEELGTSRAKKVFPEFVNSSYMKRYELFCRKLVLERHYTSAAFIISDRVNGQNGEFETPAADLSTRSFAKSLVAHVSRFV